MSAKSRGVRRSVPRPVVWSPGPRGPLLLSLAVFVEKVENRVPRGKCFIDKVFDSL